MKVVKLHGTDLFIVSLEWKIDNREGKEQNLVLAILNRKAKVNV